MKDVNKMILIGRLGADPILRETKTGAVVVHFPVATSRRVKTTDPVEEEGKSEETQWHRVVAWGRQGEACAQYLKKGQKVYVEGSLLIRKYVGKDGIERVSFEVIAAKVNFLGGGRSATSESAEGLEAEATVA